MAAPGLALALAFGGAGLAGCQEAPAPHAIGSFEIEGAPVPALWTGDDRVPFVATPADSAEAQDLAAAGATTIHYLNFSDGTTVLTKGPDDAPNNVSGICGTAPDAYPLWRGTEEDKREAVTRFAEAVADFNVILVTNRPDAAVYSMEMIGPQGMGCEPGRGVLGIAPMDCGNRNRRNVSFTFGGTWVTSAQETGHAFGLEHVDVECDVMGASYSSKGCDSDRWGYPDETGAIIGGQACGITTQNSRQRMIENLGLWPGGTKPDPFVGPLCSDAAAPVVSFGLPLDGARVGNAFRVEVDASDDCGIANVRLRLEPVGLEDTLRAPPFSWNLEEIEGTQTLIAEAADETGKITTAAIVIMASDAPPEPDGGSDGGEDQDAGGVRPAGGGGCAVVGADRTARPGPFELWLFGAAGWAAARRRRWPSGRRQRRARS